VAIAVALDATVVRALLVPSTMRLLGDLNWWLPERMRRFISTRLHLPETATLLLAAVAVIGLVGCRGPILANEPPARPPITTPSPVPSLPTDPQLVVLPRDEAPHDRLTEWWYYTGHLRSGDGRTFGFEFVIFRAERGSFPVTWASHLALTDEAAATFTYEQRSEIGPQVDLGAPEGFALAIRGGDDRGVMSPAAPWRMSGAGGRDSISAAAETFVLELELEATRGDPVLHDGDGWIDFGPAGSSYYYSWPSMTASGTLVFAGQTLDVAGTAWFDHQWGDFIAVGGGGWDWFAINLDDGTDLTFSLVRAADGSYPLVYGTLVRPDGSVAHLTRDEFDLVALDTWTSSHSGASYPAGWQIEVPAEGLSIELTPTVADQELDTRATTGVVYWEGSQEVEATRSGEPVAGAAYVELTGYAPAATSLPTP
jgi:predicted secreted hydrolase